ncbi:putative ABC transport system permease protein [Runella defluvii]|uniref:Putative ABC transport system permease protein n=1 Tax=Runella defluvii TaxID=370973 RepID=A0A7W5ZM23_9BACT|nr:ABC transporter permease [Runella defluvii]MBB3839451.1 putative ABC transport system permease protein [Runella defluvii]
MATQKEKFEPQNRLNDSFEPPRWPARLLDWFVAPHLREDLQGDLYEIFQKRAEQVGIARAKWEYTWAVLHYLTPYFFKRKPNKYPKRFLLSPDMLRNYVKIALRNLAANKAFAAINIVGLAVGLACFMLIAVFVYDELHYDTHAANARNIYRVQLLVTGNGDVAVYPHADAAVGEGMKAAFPEIKASSRLLSVSDFVKFEDKQFKEEHLAFADANLLSLFSVPFLEGSVKEALTAPNTIVVTSDLAKKYFGKQNPLGKSLAIGTQKTPYKVTGVIDKLPDNSHFHFDAFLSLSTFKIPHPTWSNVGYYTYLELKDNADARKLEAKFPQLVAKYVVPEVQQDMGISLAEAQKSVDTFRFKLQPLTDIHLHSHTKYELESNGDVQYVYIFSILAFFILLLACANFTNLSTAYAARRSREVGIRKVMGSIKKHIVFQFLIESVLLTFFAMLLAYAVIWGLLPFFNQVTDKHTTFAFFLSARMLFVLCSVSLFAGILAGIYPAFFLSSFTILTNLKGTLLSPKMQKKSLHNGLIVFQFFISTVLIISTIVVNRQLNYMQNKKLGYDKDQLLFLPDTRALAQNQVAFQQQLLQHKNVISASVSRNVPTNKTIVGTQVFPKNDTGNGTEIHTDIFNVDYDYIRTLSLTMLQGRNFSKEFATDSSGVIINEAAVKELGWNGTNPVGKTIVGSGQVEWKVIGVVKDFNYTSVKQKIAPLMLTLGNNGGGLVLKIKTNEVPSFLADLRKQWQAFTPDIPLQYHFVDEKYASLYVTEQRTQQLFTVFSLLAVIIAGLGLFALSAFVIEQRTKEIGVRKVMGASVVGIVALLSKDFLKLILVAIVMASPIGWYAMTHWLENFAYRIEIQWWVFALSGFLAVAIALLTVSFQAIKAALMNPVKSLRAE